MSHGLAESGVQGLDGVCRVDQLAQLDGEREERYELVPSPFPGGDHRRVALTPAVGELAETHRGSIHGWGGVDLAQLAAHRRPVLLRRVAQARADQVHDAQLDLRPGPRRPDRIRESLQSVAADDEGVGDAAVAQLGQHGAPELRSFAAGWSDPHAEHLAFTVQVDAHGHIDGPVGDVPVTDLDHDRIDQDHRIHRIERPRLERLQVLNDRVSDPADRVPRHLGPVDLGEVGLDVAGRHPLRVERHDVARQPVETTLSLAHRGRLEARVAVPRDSQLDLTDLGRHRLRCRPVTRVARVAASRSVTFVAEMVGHLDLQASLQHLAHQTR